MKHAPIRRSQYLVKLSRQHHFGLLLCWKIRQGIKYGVSPDRIISYIDYCWKNDLKQHFKDEEDTVFVEVDDPLINRAIDEHKTIQQLIDDIYTVPEADKETHLSMIENMIESHIRFEERQLFPMVESKISESALEIIERKLDIRNHAFRDEFQDEFWLNKK